MSSADLLEELEANGIRVKYLGTPFITEPGGKRAREYQLLWIPMAV